MRLRSVEIRDYRSIFVDDAGQPFRLDLADGANTFVGQNNCGKSNVLRAISLALDPNHRYSAEDDTPGPRPFSHPIITLSFVGDASNQQHAAMLHAADAYERSVGVPAGQTRAVRGEVAIQVSFVPGADGVRRQETVLTDSHVRGSLEAQEELLANALERLREAVRFVLISSGESIESVLEGNFREILHNVVRERLRREFETAERSRQAYVVGLQDSLLAPLRDRLLADVGGMFPEIEAVLLSPEVSSIDRTLSNVEVSLADLVTTPLAGKGTGVRGGVLVAMLSYLAVNATRSMVFAIEEPEAFLHPAAQEDLRDHLDVLAAASGVTLLVTTHSPFTVTGSPRGRVFCLAKDREGRTRLAQSSSGDADHAPLIGSLLRQATFESILTAATALPGGTEAVVLVEGPGDRFCMELAADVVGRPDLLVGLHIRPTGGTVRMIAEAVIVRAAVEVPVVIVVDNDPNGREARKSLTGHKFGFEKKQVISYAEVFEGGKWAEFGVEAEDLFDPDLIQRFVEHHGTAIIDGSRKRPDGSFHYDLSLSAKEALEVWLREETRSSDVVRWVELLLLARTRAGLTVPPESAKEIVAAAAAPAGVPSAVDVDGLALIFAGQHDYARYLDSATLVIDADAAVPGGISHVGFYARAIQTHIAAIVRDYPNLLFTAGTVADLRSTGSSEDARAAELIEKIVQTDGPLAGGAHRLVLLSPPNDAATLVLDQPIENTKQIGGRPVAWTLGPKVVPVQALLASPPTTDDLDAVLAEAAASHVGSRS